MSDRYSEIFISFMKDWSKRFISEFCRKPANSLPANAQMFPIAILDVMLNGIQQGPESLTPNTIMIDTHRWFEQSGTKEQYRIFGLYHDGMIDIIKKQYENRDEIFNGYPETAGDYMTPEEGLFLLTICIAAKSAVDYFGHQQLPYDIYEEDDIDHLYQFLCRALYDFRYETSKEHERRAMEFLANARSGTYVDQPKAEPAKTPASDPAPVMTVGKLAKLCLIGFGIGFILYLLGK